MATTTNYGWTTPDDTALVKDGAAAIRTLGSSVDTTTKNLNPETTLGDLAYRSSTANVNTRLALGTAGQILQVNSGATAPEWATPASLGGMTLLSTTTLSGASTTISAINQTFVDLYIRIDQPNCASAGSFRIAPNGSTSNCFMTGSSYDRSSVTGRGLNFTYVTQGTSDLKANDTQSNFHLYINGYSTNYTKKTALWYGTFINPSDTWHAISYGGHISDGAHITSLVFTNSAGNLTGGTVYVYGVK